MKVADYIANWIADINPRVYGVCGAGAMHLNDAVAHHPCLDVMAMHHEQAAAFAAEADARVSGKPGIVLVTAGPGGTNAITGIASAYVDSIPMIVVAGQVTTTTLKSPQMRQLGLNELDGTAMVKGITKYAKTLTDPYMVPMDLAAALFQATTGRPGPVWLEVPLDIQNAEIPDQPVAHIKPWIGDSPDPDLVRKCVLMLQAAKRPVLILGNGARDADLGALLDRLPMPVVSSWNGADLINHDHPCYIGRMGVFGDRASNYAVQHADVILAVGTRLSVAQIGHHADLFAPNARKIVVDIDNSELSKPTVHPTLAIRADASLFCTALALQSADMAWPCWVDELGERKKRFPTMLPEYRHSEQGVNAYFLVEQMREHLQDDAVVVTDVGAAFIATMQTLHINGRQRLFHSSGVSAMGYGFPASIGAWRAGRGRQTVCLSGDGGMMLNLQELQTVAHYSLPIAIFILCNNGYMTIQTMQDNHFGRHAMSSPETGLSCPDFSEVVKAFGIPVFSLFDNDEAKHWIGHVLTRQHPIVCIVHLSRDQKLQPRVQSKLVDGRFVTTGLDDMYPPITEALQKELQ